MPLNDATVGHSQSLVTNSSPSEVENDSVSFADVIQAAAAETPWHERFQMKKLVNLKNGYIVISSLSFVLMAIFGIVSIDIFDECNVPAPTDRCCECLDLRPDQLQGQTMPRSTSVNNLYYGLVMIINSGFGIYYVFTGVMSENKYQILIMLVTQFLECCRGLVDTALDKPNSPSAVERRDTATGLMIAASVLFLLSCVVVTPVYRSFGWATSKRIGARRSTLQLYKRYQRFRALNRLDIQSSFLLFLIFLGYIASTEAQGSWVWIVLFLCDALASRFMVKYLKQEDKFGVAVSMVSKTFIVAWWAVVVYQYDQCYSNYEESRAATDGWWNSWIIPNLQETAASFNGRWCLGRDTFHDARTYELVVLNFAQALIFRFASMAMGMIVVANFGKGLKSAMYSLDEEQAKIGKGVAKGGDTDDEDEAIAEFVPMRTVKAEDLAANRLAP
jgi:hypothetical protein